MIIPGYSTRYAHNTVKWEQTENHKFEKQALELHNICAYYKWGFLNKTEYSGYSLLLRNKYILTFEISFKMCIL